MKTSPNSWRFAIYATAAALLAVTVIAAAARQRTAAQAVNPQAAHPTEGSAPITSGSGQRDDAALPRPGMVLERGRFAIVLTDPQVDFFSPKGVAWSVVGESVMENKTVEHVAD